MSTSRRIVLFVTLVTTCLSSILLVSCAGETVDQQTTPTPSESIVTAFPRTPTFSARPTPLPEPTTLPTESPSIERPFVEHTVQPGDTLLGLATEYGVPMAAIQLQNRMGGSTVVQVGQVLSIPPQAGWEGASRFWVVHVVQAGETLVGIARAYGLKAATLKAVNGLADSDLIVVGQELVLPLDVPAVARAPVPTATPVPSPTSPPSQTPAVPGASLTLTPSLPPPTVVPAAPPPADVAAWPRETVLLINKVRAQHGLAPLIYNETLALAAQGQASDCAQRGWCSHTGSDGSNIKTRILRAGYDPASWAECWAQRQTPQGAVDIWMDEVPPNDPHRRTLLTTWLSEIGVGVAQASWGYYFIADFGQPRGGS